LYNTIRNQTIIKMGDALAQDSDTPQRGLYGNILQQIESMRLVCDFGLHYASRHDKMKSGDKDNWADGAREAFRVKGDMGTIRCILCRSSLDVTESLGDDAVPHYTAHVFSCLEYACVECSYRNRKDIKKTPCGYTPICPVTPISTSSSAFEEVSGGITEGLRLAQHSKFPSKTKALISDLQQPQNKDAKWCVNIGCQYDLDSDVISIVFSTWRMTLDVIQAALEQAQIQSVRFDGKVSQNQRQPVLNKFKSNPSVRIILLTLDCRAVEDVVPPASCKDTNCKSG
jgi:SNF2 family DNA or RNA helicase